MRRIARTTRFARAYKKLPAYIQGDLDDKLKLLIENPYHPLLRTHKLKGTLQGGFAFYLRDGFRAIFMLEREEILLVDVGPHDRYDRWKI